jgi:serine/threonine protein kinase
MVTQTIKRCGVCQREYSAVAAFCPYDGSQLDAVASGQIALPPDPFVGAIIERRYRIEEPIGYGGMGTVYRAIHTELKRPFAIKLIRHELVSDPVAMRRFRREALALGAITHPNAVNVTDCGVTDDGVAFLIMLPHAASLLNQIAAAVTAAHRVGVIHRDLKPENIVVVETDAGEVAKVLDFGIARLKSIDPKTGRLTASGIVVGTPRYMSPEACQGLEQSPASDIYSLGIILYEMITGRVPYETKADEGEIDLASHHIYDPTPPPSAFNPHLPAEIDAILARALAKQPEDRYETPSDLARAFDGAVSTMLDEAPATNPLSVSLLIPAELRKSPPTAPVRAAETGALALASRRPVATAVVAVLILLALAAAIAIAAWAG